MTFHQAYDPKKIVRLKAVRALFISGARVEPGAVFELEAQQCGDILATGRAGFANDDDRGLVFKSVEVFR